jgi:uncharacterized membrane protein YebE (DUF533 family)
MQSESQHLSVIRIWAALAWADGVIAQAEAAVIKRLIDQAGELTDEERNRAYGFLETKVDLETANLRGLSSDAREGIYRAAVRLAWVDLEFADDEKAFLARLRDGLGLSEAKAREIEGQIPPPKKK